VLAVEGKRWKNNLHLMQAPVGYKRDGKNGKNLKKCRSYNNLDEMCKRVKEKNG